jgi:hypothetical protein
MRESNAASPMAPVIEAASRAFGMLVFIIAWLWSSHRAFPSNWLALGLLFVALIPVAMLYAWLTDPRSKMAAANRFFPVPKLVVTGAGAFIVIFACLLYDAQVAAVFYPAASE